MTYIFLAVLLLAAELIYFRIADKCNIIDKPNERSSHSTIVLRGGGIIFAISMVIWSLTPFPSPMGEGSTTLGIVEYWPFVVGLVLVCGVSFVDDIHSLPDSLRLVTQFLSMFLVFQEVGLLFGGASLAFGLGDWLVWGAIVLAALIVAVAGTNIFNFMDGINGITGGYALAMLIPLYLKNEALIGKCGEGFVDGSLLIVMMLSALVFCYFNFRTKAKCFAGDVGSIGMAFIMVFCFGRLMYVTGDITWIVFYLLYGLDGMLTICHRIMLHENLGQAHRKHVFQLMANELKIPHVVVSSIYMVLQLAFSLVAIYVVPDTLTAHWIYLVVSGTLVTLVYILFKMKYYHLHEEYLASLKK